LLLIAIAFLLLGVASAWLVAHLQTEHHAGAEFNPEAPAVVSEHSVIGGSSWEGIKAIFESRYLMGIAAYVIILTIMATFIYFTRLNMVAALADDTDSRTVLLANIDFYTQLATLALQLSLTGHLMRRLGVHVALILLPITVALGFIGLAMVGTMTVFILLDASFRAVQRGITRPARETLYTVVSREEKYKAKAVIDTFFYRAGDVVGAQTEGLLARLGMGIAALTMTVLPLAIAWAALGLWLGRAQTRKLQEKESDAAQPTVAAESAS
jgi:ATP:ADP antiporter, AAA family